VIQGEELKEAPRIENTPSSLEFLFRLYSLSTFLPVRFFFLVSETQRMRPLGKVKLELFARSTHDFISLPEFLWTLLRFY
jgi:hypothetical protein